jgi:hypothetical protein
MVLCKAVQIIFFNIIFKKLGFEMIKKRELLQRAPSTFFKRTTCIKSAQYNCLKSLTPNQNKAKTLFDNKNVDFVLTCFLRIS